MRPKKEYIVEVKSWYDNQSGQSYFSGRVYDLRMKLLHIMPFQHGSGSHPENTAVAWIQSTLETHEHRHDIWRKCYFNKQNSLKKDVVRFGIDHYNELQEEE